MEQVSFINLTSSIPWPVPEKDDARIATQQFLEAAKVILKIFDHLGKVYIPVKLDVEGNITKLSAKFSQNPEMYTYIQDMIEYEVSNGENYAAESLLWLKRGLHFICLFLHGLVLDYERNLNHESLLELMRLSYEISLKPYHNWMIQKFFVILSRAAPTRKELLRSLSQNKFDESIRYDEIIERVRAFVEGLRTNLQVIFDLYLKLKLDDKMFESLPLAKES